MLLLLVSFPTDCFSLLGGGVQACFSSGASMVAATSPSAVTLSTWSRRVSSLALDIVFLMGPRGAISVFRLMIYQRPRSLFLCWVLQPQRELKRTEFLRQNFHICKFLDAIVDFFVCTREGFGCVGIGGSDILVLYGARNFIYKTARKFIFLTANFLVIISCFFSIMY